METRIHRAGVAAVWVALGVFASGCGLADGSSAFGGAVASRGAITAKSGDSISVNGAWWDASGAAVILDGRRGGAGDLHVGMVVTLRADDSGIAREIEFDDAVEGRVVAVSEASSTLVVGGTIVKVDDATVFEHHAARLQGVRAGEDVAVSGFVDDKGGLRAARVARRSIGGADDSFELEVKGTVLSVDAAAAAFSLDAFGTEYRVTMQTGVALPAGIAAGALVEVKALSADLASTPPSIVAARVTLEDRAVAAASARVEVEGFVKGVTPAAGGEVSFDVSGQAVIAPAGFAGYVNGTADDLFDGQKVEVEGTLDANGVLVATKISFRANVRITAPIGALDAIGGTFELLGLTVAVDAFAEVNARGGAALAAIPLGAEVEIRGRLSSDGTKLIATRVDETRELARIDDPVRLRGSLEVSGSALSIIGIAIAVDSNTEYRDLADAPITAQQFLDAVKGGGVMVEAKTKTQAGFDAAAGTLLADELQIESAAAP